MTMMVYLNPVRQSPPARNGGRGGLILAVLCGTLLVAGAIGLDTARSMVVRARLAQAVDAAALAGGRVYLDPGRDAHIRKFFEAAFPAGFLGSRPSGLAIDCDPKAGTLTVSGRATVHSVVLGAFGKSETVVEAASTFHRPSRRGEPVLSGS